MPILWRYILKHYFKVFFLCISSFICVLLIMRAQEIARFAVVNAKPLQVCYFTLYQLPYILPFAIPISGLIASILLIQGLKQTHELTALRACGYHLNGIYSPLVFSAAFLCAANFLVISELAPFCKFQSTKLLYNSVTSNPLMLLYKSKFIKIKDSVVDIHMSNHDNEAHHLLFAFLDPTSKKLSVIGAKRLVVKPPLLLGSSLYTLSSTSNSIGFDDLFIENLESMSMDAYVLSTFLQKTTSSLHYDQLSTRMCIEKMQTSPSKTPGLFELYKRLFFTLTPMTFVFLGMCCSLGLGRKEQSSIYKIALLTLVVFIAYVLGKALHKRPLLALICYLSPHPFIFYISIRLKSKFEKGIEQ